MNQITKEKLNKYFEVTGKALEKALESGNRTTLSDERDDFIDMIQRYFSDAKHFFF